MRFVTTVFRCAWTEIGILTLNWCLGKFFDVGATSLSEKIYSYFLVENSQFLFTFRQLTKLTQNVYKMFPSIICIFLAKLRYNFLS